MSRKPSADGLNVYHATSFATRQDLAAYIACRDGGHTGGYCTSHAGGGDNGEGAWDDPTWRTDIAYCAVEAAIATHNRQMRVTLQDHAGNALGVPFLCKVGDKGDHNTLDLNPGALKLAGLDPDMELDAVAIWEWV